VHDSACILNLEWQNWCGFVNNPELLDLQLNFLGAGLYWLLWDDDLGLDLNDGLSWHLGGVGDHTLGDGIVN